MSKYLLIESRDPYESRDVDFSYQFVTDLTQAGHEVTLFLVQNGVLPARSGAHADGLGALLKLGVKVLADEFSLTERGLSAERLTTGVKSAPLDVVLDHLAAGHKTLWH